MKYNDEGQKYRPLVNILKKYSCVPEEWYKQYIVYYEDVEKLKENFI